jgi:hypothetical protein
MVEQKKTQESGLVHLTCRLPAFMSDSSADQLALLLLQPSSAPPPLPVGWHSAWRPGPVRCTTVVAAFETGIYISAREGIAMLASSAAAVKLDALPQAEAAPPKKNSCNSKSRLLQRLRIRDWQS